MTIVHDQAGIVVHHGDCLDVLRELADDSVDAVVTDPPYGLEFMGKDWDGADGFRRSLNAADAGRDNAFGRASRTSPEYRAGHLFQEWCALWAAECLRVLKPGGHLLAFGGTRTWHRLAVAVEDAGFGFGCVAIEREADYLPLIVQRLNRRLDPVAAVRAADEDAGLFDLLDDEEVTA